MKSVGLDITVEGDISDFLGVKIERKPDGTVHLNQPQLIDQILKLLRFDHTTTPKSTPAASSIILHAHPESETFDDHFDYRSVVGKLLYLEKSTRPDIAYAVHQCARFCADPKVEHGKAIKWLGRYLLGTKDKGIILKPGPQSFDCYVDADFSGNWLALQAHDPVTARSCTGFIIANANCPITWASRL